MSGEVVIRDRVAQGVAIVLWAGALSVLVSAVRGAVHPEWAVLPVVGACAAVGWMLWGRVFSISESGVLVRNLWRSHRFKRSEVTALAVIRRPLLGDVVVLDVQSAGRVVCGVVTPHWLFSVRSTERFEVLVQEVERMLLGGDGTAHVSPPPASLQDEAGDIAWKFLVGILAFAMGASWWIGSTLIGLAVAKLSLVARRHLVSKP